MADEQGTIEKEAETDRKWLLDHVNTLCLLADLVDDKKTDNELTLSYASRIGLAKSLNDIAQDLCSLLE